MTVIYHCVVYTELHTSCNSADIQYEPVYRQRGLLLMQKNTMFY